MENLQVTEYIDGSIAEQRVILTKLRALIHEAVPETIENYKWGRPVFAKTKDYAYLKIAKAYVTLGFFSIENLSDPSYLLEGTGKDMRHIKIKSVNGINRELLTAWLQAASLHTTK